jgi:RNA polymerase sigma-70 factor (ECF subfamily)
LNDQLSAFQLRQVDESMVIALARSGDSQAFAELVRRFQSRVRSFMRRVCNHPDMADDLAQQVFLKVWKSISRLKTPGAFYGWLRKIMVSTWLEEVRRNKLETAELDENAEWEARKTLPGERIDLDAALGQLSPTMRLCVVLAYNDGMSHQEISDVTGFPLGTVKANISRGVAKLKSLLSDYNESEGMSSHAE